MFINGKPKNMLKPKTCLQKHKSQCNALINLWCNFQFQTTEASKTDHIRLFIFAGSVRHCFKWDEIRVSLFQWEEI